jgi:hypothetical protein
MPLDAAPVEPPLPRQDGPLQLEVLVGPALATIPQHHWVGKLLGFDFTVEYKPGAANAVADALSQRDTEEGALLALSAPRFKFIDRLRQAQHINQLSSPFVRTSASTPTECPGRSPRH